MITAPPLSLAEVIARLPERVCLRHAGNASGRGQRRGTGRFGWAFTLAAAASNLIQPPKLPGAAA